MTENNSPQQVAIIIGAGPAGLTAAYELLKRTDIKPRVFELDDIVGGISRTVRYRGNRIDIGGHRFFSKSDRVMQWWQEMMPLEARPGTADGLVPSKPDALAPATGPDPTKTDLVMLVRTRLSRIFFLRKFFSYPVSLNMSTIRNLGAVRLFRIMVSYMRARAMQIREEKSLEDFFINRFGRELYLTFFKDYTEKVWGVPCDQIKPEWGAQRIKGLSVTKAILHALKHAVPTRSKDLSQKDTETSLIDQFMYPKFGPGQMWEEVTRRVLELGGEIHHGMRAVRTGSAADRIGSVTFEHTATGEQSTFDADYVFSTMPIKEFVANMGPPAPPEVAEIAQGLQYRDFITVGLLLSKMLVTGDDTHKVEGNRPPDNWIYIQERDVRLGRLQIFNNWSPYMVADPKNVWVGLEYFCNEGDELWDTPDSEFIAFAIAELAKIGMISSDDVLDSTLIRMRKAYPAYFGTYDRLETVRSYLNGFSNLFLIGRNGMHRYNNSDHSMLTAMVAVDNIIEGIGSKENIWAVNTEKDYHEEKDTAKQPTT